MPQPSQNHPLCTSPLETQRRFRILAVGHEASLTGAPLLLLSYLTAAHSKSLFEEIRILLDSGGEITDKYKQIADTLVENNTRSSHGLPYRIFQKLDEILLGGSWRNYRLRKWLEGSQPPDIIYANTVASIDLVSRLLPILKDKPAVVIHFHELDWLLQKHTSKDNIRTVISNCTRFIAPCKAVAESATSLLDIPADLIEIVPEWICRQIDIGYYHRMRSEVRNSLGLSSKDILCIGVGKMQWRKGSDLLPLIARKCFASNPGIHLAWIGSFTADEQMQVEIEFKKIGAESNIHLIPQQQDPYPYYSGADIYILPSREDPCPIAMLEAGMFELPVVCFDQSGGASEYINNGAGIAVPYLDVEAFASAIYRLSINPTERTRMGEAGRTAILKKHNIRSCEQMITKFLLDSITKRPQSAKFILPKDRRKDNYRKNWK